MNKDVIYIDVDDDVTAIIGKLKASTEKIIALVPPKRAGALQSAVNLRLLDRMAKNEKKSLVLVTNNQALVALAASAKIPVARNLQSKPEIAEIPALVVDDGDDIIDGSELPVGDHAQAVPVKDGTRPTTEQSRSDIIDSLDDDTALAPLAAATASGSGASAVKQAKAKKSRSAIPNFDSFRKKLFLGIGGGILLVALLVWMFVFAPAATVIITARTSPAPVSTAVRLSTTDTTNVSEGLLRASTQTLQKDVSIEFDATGTRDVGDRATGVVRFSTDSISALGTTIPAGTRLTTANGQVFTTDTAVTMTFENRNGVNSNITATESGTSFNGVSGAVRGQPSNISASIQGQTSGGTSRQVRVVSAADIERARGDLLGQSTDAYRTELTNRFREDARIEGSFSVTRGQENVSPAIDQEATTGKARLTIPTSYAMYAVADREVESYLQGALNEQIVNQDTQRIYQTGASDATLGGFTNQDGTLSATLTATGRIGPKIDENAIKEEVRGKIFGEVQSAIGAREGVQDVDVQFSYFWVRTVPDNPDKITIEFQIEDEN